ncbi:MAG TPA: co-chaperone GroES [Candidatus Saccharimonadales bacterium]
MSVKVQPLADYVVAQAEEAKSKTASGLYLPGNATEKPKVAKVVAVGKEVEGIKVNDRILYKNEYEATNVKVDGDEYIIIYKKNIVATVA